MSNVLRITWVNALLYAKAMQQCQSKWQNIRNSGATHADNAGDLPSAISIFTDASLAQKRKPVERDVLKATEMPVHALRGSRSIQDAPRPGRAMGQQTLNETKDADGVTKYHKVT